MLSIFFYTFILIVLIQIIYFTAILGSVTSYKPPKPNSDNKIPVSVLVYIKDQAEYLKKIVPLLVNQSYPNFEIVLVNNASEDDSIDIMKEFAEQYSNIKIVDVVNNETFWGNKKYALTLGIKAAKNEHLLFTEANSYPDSNNWITDMCFPFSKNKSIIIGHNRISIKNKSLINKLFRFQNTLSCANIFSWTLLGKPFIGYANNLAYKKEEFFKTNGFIDHMNKPNGEDVLFINQISNSDNTTICSTQTGFTVEEKNNRFLDWIVFIKNQNKKISLLNFIDQLKFRFLNFTQILFFITAIVLLCFKYNWIIVLGIISFRYLIIWLYAAKIFKNFSDKDIVYWFPALEFIHTFTQFFIFISKLLSKSKH